jgi:hypothetical protein
MRLSKPGLTIDHQGRRENDSFSERPAHRFLKRIIEQAVPLYQGSPDRFFV